MTGFGFLGSVSAKIASASGARLECGRGAGRERGEGLGRSYGSLCSRCEAGLPINLHWRIGEGFKAADPAVIKPVCL
jgi:hypothetical protein